MFREWENTMRLTDAMAKLSGRWLIRTYTNPGEKVLDATMGSGTTLVAAKLEDRNGIGIEKEDKYFEIAKKRIEESNG